jgi:hypothetical protein
MNPQHAMHGELASQRNLDLLREAHIDERSAQRSEVDVAVQAARPHNSGLGLVASWISRRRLIRRPAFHSTGS